jgi:hypothetical protein
MASGRTRIFPSSDGWLKPYLEQMYGQAQQAKREALDKPGVMCTIAPKQLVELICGAQSRNPAMELDVVDSRTGNLEARLIEGDLEVAVLSAGKRA